MLISSIGFGSIGKVQAFDKSYKCATVSEVTIIRDHPFQSYYLQVLLQSLVGQLQFDRYTSGATGQLHLYPQDVEKMLLPAIDFEIQEQVADLVSKSKDAKKEAKNLLEEAKRMVEEAVLGAA